MNKIKKALATIGKNAILTTLDEIEKFIPPSFYTHNVLFACKIAATSFFDLYPGEYKEFLELIRAKINQISGELFSSNEFQQSLALTFETLLRTREQKKRDLIRKIYLEGYLPAEERYKVNLERFYRIAQEISIEGLEYLKFINDEILPIKEKWARGEVKKMNKENREHNDDWWLRLTMRNKPDSEIIMQWIYNEYNPNSKKVQAGTPNVLKGKQLREKQFAEEEEKYNQYAEVASELISLGIFKTVVSGGLVGQGASSSQTLTEFGQEFIKFVKGLSFQHD